MPQQQQTEELQLATEDAPNIDTLKRVDAPAILKTFTDELAPLEKESLTIVVTDGSQIEIARKADEKRKAVKALRCAAENKREDLVAGMNKSLKAINAEFGEIWDRCQAVEKHLKEQVEFAANAEAARVAKLQAERSQRLLAVGGQPPFYPKLGEMPEEGFAQLIEGLEVADRLKKEREAKAEADRLAAEKAAEEARLAKEKADAEERARIAAENERLRKEAAEKEAALKAEREAAEKARKEAAEAARKDAQRVEAEAAKERQQQAMAMEEIQGIQQQAVIAVVGRAGVRKGGTMQCLQDTLKETEEWPIDDRFGALKAAAQSAKDAAIAAIKGEVKAFTDRQEAAAAAAKAKAEREEADAKAKAEQDKLAAEAAKQRKAKEKLEADQKAKADAEEAARKADEAAKLAAAKAPDRDKLRAFAQALRAMELPLLSTKEGSAVVAQIMEQQEKFAAWVEKKAEGM